MPKPNGAGTQLFPPIIRQNIINEWLAGVGGPELARRYHCSPNTIALIVKPYPRDRSWHAKAVRLYQDGQSLYQIAVALGKSPQGIRRVLVAKDIPRRPRGGANYRKK